MVQGQSHKAFIKIISFVCKVSPVFGVISGVINIGKWLFDD